MRRYALVGIAGDGGATEITPAGVGTSYVVLAYVGARALVKLPLADGTAADNQTIADLDTTNGAVDVTATALTAPQISAAKTRLAAAGIDVSAFDSDGIDDRRKLLRFLLRRWLGWRVVDFPLAISGYDVTP